MPSHLFSRPLIWLSLLAFTLVPKVMAEETAPSLLTNGDFEASRDDVEPKDWPLGDNVSWLAEDGNHFLRLKSPAPGTNVSMYRAVQIPAGVEALQLSYRVRYSGIKRGGESWFDGRIMLNFKDANKNLVAPSPAHPYFTGTSKGWEVRNQKFKVPAGSKTLEIILGLIKAESGQLDFDDIRLVPISADAVAATDGAAVPKEATSVAAIPTPKSPIEPPPPSALPPMLHVAGNQLHTADGKVVWLQGLAVPSLEWSASGENVLKSIEVGLTTWKANCIRLCLSNKFYAGHGPGQADDGGLRYRQIIEDAVNLCASHGAYIVLDLHEYRAPTEEHAAFWKSLTRRFKDHPSVIFELLNEPHDISWDVWQNGGTVTDQKSKTDAEAENKEKLKSFQSVGMQGLVNVIRETGAHNLIIAGGLDWGYDLSGVVNGHALKDDKGNGVMYSSHVYPWKRDWQGKFLAASEKYPVFIGEVGADSKPMDFIPLSAQEDPATWVPDMLGVIQKYHLNWTAWSFHPHASPRVLLDWDYTPTPFWGEFVKEALSGKQFEVKRLR